jgi:hypothetical protein
MLDEKKINYLRTGTVADLVGMPSAQDGDFGVEIEIEGNRLPSEVPGWVVHREGSLRGNAKEYVTNGAVSMKVLDTALDYLAHAFNGWKTEDNSSYRAGVHIHRNMQKRSLDSAIRAVIQFTLVEPIFLKLCGDRRDGNLFCMPAYDTGDIHNWLDLVYAQYNDGNEGHLRRYLPRGKYAALNVDPLVRFGSLECRAFPSTTDKTKILRWAHLLDLCLAEHNQHPLEMIRQADSQTEEFLQKIFGPYRDLLPGNAPSLLGFGAEQIFLMADIYSNYMGETL